MRASCQFPTVGSRATRGSVEFGYDFPARLLESPRFSRQSVANLQCFVDQLSEIINWGSCFPETSCQI
jgi:hypothetical protein